ncbi:MAG: pimeloyl-ACP methyl ester carboxylesterase [Halioglobus sp.]|jgi:pimeloyl-ACP methyl ester carboxylesterase
MFRNIKIRVMAIAFIVIVLSMVIYSLWNPLDNSSTIAEFYNSNLDAGPDAELWGRSGSYFRWQSSQTENSQFPELNIFYRTFGNMDNPAIVMIHGWPTSSYDFKELIGELEKEYYIAVIDTPGYGFSDKPKGGYRYSIPDDAQLVDHFIREVLGLSIFTLFTHDKGDSVGFAFLTLYQQTDSPAYQIDHHFILNGGIYLPLAELSAAQKYLTLPGFGQLMTRFILTPDRFTRALAKVYLPALTQQEQLNMSSTFTYQGGTTVFPKTLRYLQDRHKLEKTWLQTLSHSEIPATLIWGERDPIAKTEIADFVWENHLRNRGAAASYWRLPCASHYPQNDQPKIVAQLVRLSLSDESAAFTGVKNSKCAPVLVQEM